MSSELQKRSAETDINELEIALVDRLKQRDHTAVELVYDAYGGRVYSLIFCMVRDVEIAEDLVQETFLRVWMRIGTFEGARGAFGPWMLAIARNRTLDHLRSSDHRRSRSERRSSMDSVAEQIDDPRLFADLERSIRIADNSRTLSEAFGRLSPEQRTVIRLAYFEGFTQTEIATKTGRPLGTVKTMVRTALQFLRRDFVREQAAPGFR